MPDDKILQWLDDEEYFPDEKVEEKQQEAYEKKIVAWLDILGIRAKIKNEREYNADKIISIMSTMSSYVTSACDIYCAKGVMNYLQIADGFMIVSDIEYATELCNILAEIQWKILVNMNMLSRGAVTVGNVSVTNNGNLIIGPAYVDAYAMESENAIYSRTIVSDTFIDETKNYLTFEYIQVDSDHVRYIDYIAYILGTQPVTTKSIKKMLVEQGVIKLLRKNFEDKSAEKLSVKQKYGWTISLLKKNKIDNI